MEYVRLGSTGMQVSRLCLGCMGFGDAMRWVHKKCMAECAKDRTAAGYHARPS
jgi:aryl-alcohol dehydrogenase-like predicted oxidoreductase